MIENVTGSVEFPKDDRKCRGMCSFLKMVENVTGNVEFPKDDRKCRGMCRVS